MFNLSSILSKKNRNLLAEMVRTDFKLRYQESVLGYLWSLLRPLLMSAVLYVVFSSVFGLGDQVPNYGSYLLLGIMCWTFFTEVTSSGIGSVVAKGDLIRKISIPRYLTVVSSSVSAAINFCLNFVVLAVIMATTGVSVQWGLLLLVPLLMIQLYVFALAVTFVLAASFVKYRDINFVWDVIVQMLFYLTPILYPLSLLTDKYPQANLVMLNPVAQVIQDLRYILVTDTQATAWSEFGINAIWGILATGLLIVFASWYFRRESRYFAENV